MIPQRIPSPTRELVTLAQVCAMAEAWSIHPQLAARLVKTAASLPWDIQIFSGARSRAEQDELEREGRPTAPFDLSTHADRDQDGCRRLATGADIQPVLGGIRVNKPAIAQMGAAAVHSGLRWGGGSPVGEDGLPQDYFHVDLGPRSSFP